MGKTTVNVNFGPNLTKQNAELKPKNANKKKNLRKFLTFLGLISSLTLSTSYQLYQGDNTEFKLNYVSQGSVDSLRTYLAESMHDKTFVIYGESALVPDKVRSFYTENNFTPVWTGYYGFNSNGAAFYEMISNARDFGLEPDNYHLKVINGIIEQLGEHKSNQAAIKTELELLLTDAAFRFMINLHSGYADVDSVLRSEDWYGKLQNTLYIAIKKDRAVEGILSVQPRFIEYTNLQHATVKFVRTYILTDSFTAIQYPSKDSVKLMTQVKQVLSGLGYLEYNQTNISQALSKFQYFHGLEPDGKPGKNTVDALRQSTLQKYRKLAMNLDRLRKQENFSSRLLYINIPAYMLKVYNGNKLEDTFRVIVGNPASPTPILSGMMEKVVANPVWYVPRSITVNELLPKIKSDSTYLKRNRFKILDKQYQPVDAENLSIESFSSENSEYTIRQDNGNGNALGKVKFIFANPYSVYLHDTPAKNLFFKDIRAFSHGCVRLQDPQRLARYIITKVNAEETDFDDLIKKGVQQEISIKSALPVYIRYITCEADDKGNLFFYKDIYNIDAKEMDAFAMESGI
jgi:L,D-transpeptidase YcbB